MAAHVSALHRTLRQRPAVYNGMGVSVGSRGGAGNTMSELPDARRMLEMAERAAIGGDFSSADDLLRDAARIQETELGPLHPDLANTLNSLAIVAERTGRLVDAETNYRRAAAIASASLPADHPIVAESRKNLEDFCREHGVPIAAVVVTPSTQDAAPGLDAFAPEVAPASASSSAGTAEGPTGVRPAHARISPPISPPPSSKPSPVPRTPAPSASQPLPLAQRRSSRQFPWLAIGAIVLIAVAAFVRQPWSSREESTAPSAATNAPEPAPPPSAMPAAIEQTPAPAVTPQDGDRPRDADTGVGTDKPPSSVPAAGAISLTTAQLCQMFSTSASSWRCDPPGDSVAPGPLVLYTRVRSSRDVAVVHRWYREAMLRQAVTLTVRANMSEGYRTYSRHTVDGVGNWRVEVRSADGDLLHEQRFLVR